MKSILKDRIKLIALFIIITIVCILIVGMNAYSSELQYEINSLSSQVQEANYRIANLEVKIKSATDVGTLESAALKMGMIYPDFNRIVYIKSDTSEVQDFATALRLNAYN